MSYLIICVVALVVSALTLFSGFGLGTLLTPAFALFFPIEVAIAATAPVHLANNLFKLGLVGRGADWRIVVLFGVPAVLMAILGALLLNWLGRAEPLATYSLGAQRHAITLINLVIGGLMIVFALLELTPVLQKLAFPPHWVPVGGMLSGFFGGLSGQQGALRAAFLVRLGLTREAFIGTSVVCAVLVDLARIPVYAVEFYDGFRMLRSQGGIGLMVAGCLAAFVGSFLGSRLVKKVTMRTIQIIVGLMLLVFGIALGTGLLPEK